MTFQAKAQNKSPGRLVDASWRPGIKRKAVPFIRSPHSFPYTPYSKPKWDHLKSTKRRIKIENAKETRTANTGKKMTKIATGILIKKEDGKKIEAERNEATAHRMLTRELKRKRLREKIMMIYLSMLWENQRRMIRGAVKVRCDLKIAYNIKIVFAE